MVQKSTYSSVFKDKGFLNLWLNQILVQLSFNSLNFALIIWVFQLTNSSVAVSGLLAAVLLPAMLLGLFAGVLVDLIDRKKIIVTIDFLLALLFLSLIPFRDNYPAILVITFLVNTLAQFYTSAEGSAIPLIAKKEQLISANSIFSTTFYACFLLGFALSGPLISHFGIDFIFSFGAGALFLAFILAFTFPQVFAQPDARGRRLLSALKKGNFADIKNMGLGEIFDTINMIKGKLPILSSILILSGIQITTNIIGVLIPSFLETALHIKATDVSYILIVPLALGIASGGVVLSKLGEKFIKRFLVLRSIFFGGLIFFIIGISPIILPAIKYLPKHRPLPFLTQPSLSTVLIVGSFFLGMIMVSILVPVQTVLQENTPDKDRGKVFAALGASMAALSLIPVLLAGVLSDLFGVTPIFIGLGIIIMMCALLGLKPSFFFPEKTLPLRVREFLGLGHWERK